MRLNRAQLKTCPEAKPPDCEDVRAPWSLPRADGRAGFATTVLRIPRLIRSRLIFNYAWDYMSRHGLGQSGFSVSAAR